MSNTSDLSADDGWPEEMQVTLHTAEPEMLELLFARSVWALTTGFAIPAVDPAPVSRQNALLLHLEREMVAEWDQAWQESLEWSRYRRGSLGASGDENPQFARQSSGRVVVAKMWSPSDRNDFDRWRSRIPEVDPASLTDAGPHVIGAWRRGLRSVVVMPFLGHYIEDDADGTLWLSQHSYADMKLLTGALDSFGISQ